jgi:hypothetical protein
MFTANWKNLHLRLDPLVWMSWAWSKKYPVVGAQAEKGIDLLKGDIGADMWLDI